MNLIFKLKYKYSQFISKYVYTKKFKKFEKGAKIIWPLRIDGAENIIIGKNATINYGGWLASVKQNPQNRPILEIKSGTVIGNFNHIYCINKIVIGENVLTADKVYISDNTHCYENVHIPIIKQPVRVLSEVSIGDGTWIGENVCIFGAKIGKHCVIGSNSVVSKDIPDYCVAVGAPAKVVKRYDWKQKKWIRKVDVE